MNDQITQVTALLGGHFGWIAATLGWIAAARIAMKPWSLKLQSWLSGIINYVVDSPEQDDDTLLGKILSSRAYRIAAFAVDALLSVKLPTSQTLVDAEKAKLPPVSIILVLLSLAGTVAALSLSSGCATTQRATYQVASSTSVTVEVALKTYNVFAAQGKTTIAQNIKVKEAYERYQVAMEIVCDAGQAYAATGGADGSTSAALQEAVSNANTSLADLINLIRSFGVKI